MSFSTKTLGIQPTCPADRDPVTGQWAKGNKLGWATKVSLQIKELKKEFAMVCTKEDMVKVYQGLLTIATTDPDSRLRLAAQIYFLDRILGRPKEAVSVDVRDPSLAQSIPVLSVQQQQVIAQALEIIQPPPS